VIGVIAFAGRCRLSFFFRFLLPRAAPHGNDIADFYLNGGDVYSWLEAQLHLLLSIPDCLTISEMQMAAMEKQKTSA
jgi:hypothetical protein